jgi:hypothetical protein
MLYVCVGTDYKGYSKVLYAGPDFDKAWECGEYHLQAHPSGSFMVENWLDGGLVGGYGKTGPTHDGGEE